jgi:hypothetical protein
MHQAQFHPVPTSTTLTADEIADLSVALADSFLTRAERLRELDRALGGAAVVDVRVALTRRETTDPLGTARARRLLDAFRPEHPEHVVAFHDDPAFLDATAARFLADGVRAGELVVVIAAPERRVRFADAIAGDGIDLDGLRRSGRYREVDAAGRLASLRRGDVLDLRQLRRGIAGWIADAERDSRPLRLYGEMVALLWEQGDMTLALELESMWERLTGQLALPVLCGYPMDAFASDEAAELYPVVCARHTAVTTDAYAALGADEAAVLVRPDVPGGRVAGVG